MPRFGLRTLIAVFVAIAILLALIGPMLVRVRDASRTVECSNKLRQLGLAMLNYESVHGSLPIGIETDSGGRPTRSWRTHLYPSHMESAQQHYDPNVAWDSPKNRRLINGTPVTATDKGGNNPRQVVLDPCPSWTWCCPADSKKRVNYSVVIGDETAFPMNRTVSLGDITDGLENTILVVETLSGGPFWTEPMDIRFDSAKFTVDNFANGELSSSHAGGVNVCFADGKTFLISMAISADELRALFTISGGEPVTRQDLLDRGILK